MRRVASRNIVLAAGLAAIGALPSGMAFGATEKADPLKVADVLAVQGISDATDLKLRFIQEDGAESGHVRVELTPSTRPLTIIEARMAAEKGFLAALKEKGLGDNLSRIKVVVRLMPATDPSPDDAQQTVVYRHAGGQDWSITGGE